MARWSLSVWEKGERAMPEELDEEKFWKLSTARKCKIVHQQIMETQALRWLLKRGCAAITILPPGTEGRVIIHDLAQRDPGKRVLRVVTLNVPKNKKRWHCGIIPLIENGG
jgi:hypothetical protein